MTEPLIPSTRTSRPGCNGQPSADLHVSELPLSAGDVGGVSERESPPGTPRWVKVFGIVAIVLLLAFAGLHLTGQGGGPAMHGMPEHGVMLR